MENDSPVKHYELRSKDRNVLVVHELDDAYAVRNRRFDYGIQCSIYAVLHNGARIWLR